MRVAAVVFAEFFGNKHLGAINGIITAVTQTAGGAGPLLFSTVFDMYGSYDRLFMGLATVDALMCILLIYSCRASHPLEKLKRSQAA